MKTSGIPEVILVSETDKKLRTRGMYFARCLGRHNDVSPAAPLAGLRNM